jgi:FlaA1/EpsC-like NDP-sugar epimerase
MFNAAACKHVPLMEENPSEAIRNNVYGTRVMAQLADYYGVERMVQISTDKAINPTSVMGASKRLAELAIQGMQPTSRTRFVTVRFGNVLGSEGSCVQLFSRQIARGGPVTVTHPEVVRYFMSVDEAVRLVLNASVLGDGGEIFLLDMGEPVRILDLATAMIRLSGAEAHDDIEVRFTGLRPGEKLYEELVTDSEIAAPTSHPKIFKLREQNQRDWKTVQRKIMDLENLAMAGEAAAVSAGIRAVVPEYTPTNNGHVLNWVSAAASAASVAPLADDVRVVVSGAGPGRR